MPLRVSYGDDRYDELVALWERESSPGQFDEQGLFGYRRWGVRHRQDGTMDFLLQAAAGPTSDGWDAASETFRPVEWQPTTGSRVELAESGLEFSTGPGGEGDVRIKAVPQPRDSEV
jgi:hypothetical protein